MPVALVQTGLGRRRVPAADNPFWIGRDPACHLVVSDPRVGLRHARLRFLRGERVLTAGEGCDVWVNGTRVPVMPLRSGDRVDLIDPALPDGVTLRFENHMEDSFVPEEVSLTQAWANHPGSRKSELGPAQYGEGTALGGRPLDRIHLVEVDDGEPLVITRLAPCRAPEEGDRHRALLVALAGAPHPGLAPVVDGGLVWADDELVRWMATRFVPGETARELMQGLPIEARRVVPMLRTLAGGIAWLHARGVVHRDISPGNVVRRPDGTGTLLDFGASFLCDHGAKASGGIIGTPGYLAPEEVLGGGDRITPAVDVYGLGAVGYALLTGVPPSKGDDILATLSNSLAPTPTLREMGLTLPGALEGVILGALEAAPEARPSIDSFARGLAFAEAQLGL